MDTSAIIYQGLTETVVLPSGRKVEFRENTGQDEGKLSKLKDALSGSSFNNYLSGIVIKDFSKPENDKIGGKVTPEEVSQWLNMDRYYLMFKARVLSLGDIFKFEYTCPSDACRGRNPVLMEEDLKPFMDDLSSPRVNSKTIEVEGETVPNPDYFENRITPYPMGSKTSYQTTTTSGKTVRLQILTGLLEQASLDLPEDEQDRNQQLRIRNLELQTGSTWNKVLTFQMFSSREMVELRGLVERIEIQWNLLSEIQCPNCKQKEFVNLLTHPDFFFPSFL